MKKDKSAGTVLDTSKTDKVQDGHGRLVDYLRVSVTDRCNLRCNYCMPAEGVTCKEHSQILSYEEIIRIIRAGVELGINKVRVTGGEPLVRKGIVDFISELKQVRGIKDLSMTTNGTLLPEFALALKQAGLERVNISLDTLKKDRYEQITRRQDFARAVEGIWKALSLGLNPVKINVVLMKGINDDEVLDFVELSRNYPLHIRFIEFMPLGSLSKLQGDRYLSLGEIKGKIARESQLKPVKLSSNGPAEYFKVPGGQGTIGFITPISHQFCEKCNRLRLTADGSLRPCLADNLEIDLHGDQGQVVDQEEIKDKIKNAILLKPAHHHFTEKILPVKGKYRDMFQIGG